MVKHRCADDVGIVSLSLRSKYHSIGGGKAAVVLPEEHPSAGRGFHSRVPGPRHAEVARMTDDLEPLVAEFCTHLERVIGRAVVDNDDLTHTLEGEHRTQILAQCACSVEGGKYERDVIGLIVAHDASLPGGRAASVRSGQRPSRPCRQVSSMLARPSVYVSLCS